MEEEACLFFMEEKKEHFRSFLKVISKCLLNPSQPVALLHQVYRTELHN